MKDPYEEYVRYERRRSRIQIAIVVGAVLTLTAIACATVLWHIEVVASETGQGNSYESVG